MKPDDYFKSLTKTEKDAYARRAGTTLRNAQGYFAPSGIRRSPRHHLIVSLADASEGNVSLDEAIDYFLVAPVRSLYQQMLEQDAGRKGNGEMKRFDIPQEERAGL